MLEALKYRPVRKAAERALETISPQVPTWNQPARPEHDIVPPAGLEGFHKLVWDNPRHDMNLEHQTPAGVEPYRYTRVERREGQ